MTDNEELDYYKKYKQIIKNLTDEKQKFEFEVKQNKKFNDYIIKKAETLFNILRQTEQTKYASTEAMFYFAYRQGIQDTINDLIFVKHHKLQTSKKNSEIQNKKIQK